MYSVLLNKVDRKEVGRLLEREQRIPHDELHAAGAALDLDGNACTDSGNEHGPGAAVLRAIQQQQKEVPHADYKTLKELEEEVTDLLFALREARKAKG